MLTRKKSIHSSQYYNKYFLDEYTKQAKIQKLRSRSWFKLQYIDRIDRLFTKGMTIIDLGSSPGGWSSYAISKISNIGNVIACDILPMHKISGVDFVQGNCLDNFVLNQIGVWIKQYRKAHVILSDMSPNTTGISIVDVYKSMCLGNAALSICRYFLVPGGSFLVKIFQGDGFEQYLYSLRILFHVVKVRKPYASRSSSREVYIVAKNFKHN